MSELATTDYDAVNPSYLEDLRDNILYTEALYSYGVYPFVGITYTLIILYVIWNFFIFFGVEGYLKSKKTLDEEELNEDPEILRFKEKFIDNLKSFIKKLSKLEVKNSIRKQFKNNNLPSQFNEIASEYDKIVILELKDKYIDEIDELIKQEETQDKNRPIESITSTKDEFDKKIHIKKVQEKHRQENNRTIEIIVDNESIFITPTDMENRINGILNMFNEEIDEQINNIISESDNTNDIFKKLKSNELIKGIIDKQNPYILDMYDLEKYNIKELAASITNRYEALESSDKSIIKIGNTIVPKNDSIKKTKVFITFLLNMALLFTLLTIVNKLIEDYIIQLKLNYIRLSYMYTLKVAGNTIDDTLLVAGSNEPDGDMVEGLYPKTDIQEKGGDSNRRAVIISPIVILIFFIGVSIVLSKL